MNKNQSYCSPSSEKNLKKSGSCFNKESLIKIVNKYNDINVDDKISLTKNTPVKKISEKLNEKLNVKEYFLIDHPIIKNDEKLYNKLKKSFRPKKPLEWNKNKYEWLSTTDIMKVMKQYENNNNSFEFMGVFPIDYDFKDGMGNCIAEELCKLNMKDLKKRGTTNFGIVFNLDKHYEPGSHWVSIFCNIDKGIYYFDSNGTKPPANIHKFMKIMKSKNKDDFKIKINKTRHQFKDSECGMFSMYFLIEMLKGADFNKLIKSNFKDADMNSLRNIFYRPNKY